MLILCTGLIVYANSLFNGFVWEDWGQLVENPLIKNVANIPRFFTGGTYYEQGNNLLQGNLYRPFMLVYFTVLTSIFGTNAFVFHTAQVLMHLVNAYLVYLIFRRAFGPIRHIGRIDLIRGEKLSLFLALVFLVHPINAEAVSYISIANDPLFFFFGMLGLLLIPKNIMVMGVLFLISLFSKESGILFLAVSAVYAYLFAKHSFKKVLIVNAIVLAVFLFTRVIVGNIGFGNSGFFPMERIPLVERLIFVPKIIFFYISTFFFPLYLSVARHWYIPKINATDFFVPLVIILTIIPLTFLIAKKTLKTSENKKILYLFSLWLLIGLALYIQLLPLSMAVADRWFYFPMVGILGLLGLIIRQFSILNLKFSLKILNYKFQINQVMVLLGILIIAALSIRTIIRNTNFKDDKTLFFHDIKINPHSYMIQTSIGIIYFNESNYQEAERYFLKSLELFPFEPISWVNLGSLYEKQKDFPKALYYFKGSLDKYPILLAYERISTVELALGNLANSQEITDAGLNIFPSSAQLHFNMGLLHYKKNSLEAALQEIEKAHKLSNNNLYLEVIKKIQKGQKFNIDY